MAGGQREGPAMTARRIISTAAAYPSRILSAAMEAVDDDPPPPTDTALYIDEDMDELQRVEHFSLHGTALQKEVFVSEIASCAESLPVEVTLASIVPLIPIVAEDPSDKVRAALARQIPRLSRYLATHGGDGRAADASAEGRDAAYAAVVDVLLPAIQTLITGAAASEPAGSRFLLCPHVTEAACEALVELTACLRPDDVGAKALCLVLCLAHDDAEELNRAVAASLLGDLADVMGPELCAQVRLWSASRSCVPRTRPLTSAALNPPPSGVQFVLPEIISLTYDPGFKVRKGAAQKLPPVAAVVGVASAPRVLEAFRALCADDVWGVRKAAAEGLAGLAACTPDADRAASVLPLVDALQSDASKWVRLAAHQALGPLIASLPSGDVTAPLLEHFCDLATSGAQVAGTTQVEASETALVLAQYFPAVAHVAPAEHWPLLAPCFSALVVHDNWKIRRTLACSLHATARLLHGRFGADAVEAAVLPALGHFLQDLDEVKTGALSHLSSTLAFVPRGARSAYLGALADVQADADNWRFRGLLAAQLGALSALYPPEALRSIILPLAMALCTDGVAAVRDEARLQFGEVLCSLVMSVRAARRGGGGGEGGRAGMAGPGVVRLARSQPTSPLHAHGHPWGWAG